MERFHDRPENLTKRTHTPGSDLHRVCTKGPDALVRRDWIKAYCREEGVVRSSGLDIIGFRLNLTPETQRLSTGPVTSVNASTLRLQEASSRGSGNFKWVRRFRATSSRREADRPSGLTQQPQTLMFQPAPGALNPQLPTQTPHLQP